MTQTPLEPRIGIVIDGAFDDDNLNLTQNFLYMYVQLMHLNTNNRKLDTNDTNALSATDATSYDAIDYSENDKEIYKIPIIKDMNSIDTVDASRKIYVIKLSSNMYNQLQSPNTILRLRLSTNLPISFPVQLAYDPTPIDKNTGVIFAAIVLLGLYVMIIWEIVHRTFAAIIASTMSIAILAMMNERPTMPELMSWIDVETLLLLFGMLNPVN